MKALANKRMGRPLKGAVPLDRIISLPLEEETINRIDLARGDTPRVEWIRAAITNAIAQQAEAQ